MMDYITVFIVSFFIGSIPFGYIFVKKLKHIDIRTIGSGNIGSTNVSRAAGKEVAIVTQICDMLKGVIPVSFTIYYSNSVAMENGIFLQLTSVFGAILGHDFSPFLKFKGGKGVNTTLGAFLFLLPIPVILTGFSFKLMRLITPIVSIRSMIASLLIPFYSVLLKVDITLIYASGMAALLIIILHYENIKRLIHKNEN